MRIGSGGLSPWAKRGDSAVRAHRAAASEEGSNLRTIAPGDGSRGPVGDRGATAIYLHRVCPPPTPKRKAGARRGSVAA